MSSNSKAQIAGGWCGVAFLALWLIGFALIAHWVPPVSPASSAVEVAAIYVDRSIAIRIAMALMGIGSIFYIPFTIALADFIKKIEGDSIILSFTQLAGGIVGQITFFIPAFIWAAASFRADRDPEVILAMADVAWITFMTAWPPFVLQFASLAAAIFMDKRADPYFPRWSGYFQVLISVTFLPATLALFFKTGPFAWDGFFIFWLPLVVFLAWFLVMLPLMWAAAKKEPVSAPS